MATKILTPQEPREIKRIALYARVSTLNGQHPEMQLAELREYAARRGWQIVGEFVDIGVSGSRDSRPELNRCMDAARARKCDAILVWKLDRWARSLKFLVNNLAELTAYGVAFVSLRDNIDLSTPAGRLMVQMIGAFAEFERSLIVERVRAGMNSARARGKRLGRPSFRYHRGADRRATGRWGVLAHGRRAVGRGCCNRIAAVSALRNGSCEHAGKCVKTLAISRRFCALQKEIVLQQSSASPTKRPKGKL
jgi:DNA invertase Pin-like site-specific DNA recombinase